MSWNKSTRKLDGLNNILDVLNHLEVEHQVETLCEVRDRGLGAHNKDIEVKFLTSPKIEGGYHHKVIRTPGPDMDDQVVLEKVNHNNKNDFIVMEDRPFTEYEQEGDKYTVEEIENNEHKKKV